MSDEVLTSCLSSPIGSAMSFSQGGGRVPSSKREQAIICKHFLKNLLVSDLLMSHRTKQVTGPSLDSERGETTLREGRGWKIPKLFCSIYYTSEAKIERLNDIPYNQNG